MRNTILNELSHCEEAEGVRILLAVESGSRSWGFSSKDSDYDVRFVYVRPTSDYLRLEKTSEVINWRLDDELDIVGWDLSKYLRLLRKSNPSALEWLGCPAYLERASFEMVRRMAKKCFSTRTLAYHYLGISKSDVTNNLDKGKTTAKAYLYAIRGVLASRWAFEAKSIPPIKFSTLLETLQNDEVATVVGKLLETKRAGSERDNTGHIKVLDAWIAANIADLEKRVKSLEPQDKVSWNEMDDLFLIMLNKEACPPLSRQGNKRQRAATDWAPGSEAGQFGR